MERNNKIRAVVLILIFLSTLISSCDSYDIPQNIVQQYGQSFNETRNKVGLTLLTDSFHLKCAEYTGKDRVHSDIMWECNNDNMPGKHLILVNDIIVKESDYYMSKKTYDTIDGHLHAHLTIVYDFTLNNIKYKYKGFIPYKDNRKLFTYDEREVSKTEADSIIYSWGYVVK